MELQILWFAIWGLLWTVYFTLDGFDLGVGMLQPFLARGPAERDQAARSIGPFWDGNEVWLVTAGGATFAAFPATYAAMFSSMYTALLLVLFSLIIRGVAVELRGKEKGLVWRRSWDTALCAGSGAAALLFGVAFGNIFQGLPMDADGCHGGFLILLNPYGLLTGALFVLLFLEHGALWLALKTEGPLAERAQAWARRLWPVLAAAAVIFLAATKTSTRLYDNLFAHPALLVVPLLAVAGLAGARLLTGLRAFLSSGLAVAMVAATGIVGLYPNLIPSSVDPAWSLTAFNSSSSPYTLRIMTAVVGLFVPVVIAYQAWVYRVFRSGVSAQAGPGALY